jgi:hypothetical protein
MRIDVLANNQDYELVSKSAPRVGLARLLWIRSAIDRGRLAGIAEDQEHVGDSDDQRCGFGGSHPYRRDELQDASFQIRCAIELSTTANEMEASKILVPGIQSEAIPEDCFRRIRSCCFDCSAGKA